MLVSSLVRFLCVLFGLVNMLSAHRFGFVFIGFWNTSGYVHCIRITYGLLAHSLVCSGSRRNSILYHSLQFIVHSTALLTIVFPTTYETLKSSLEFLPRIVRLSMRLQDLVSLLCRPNGQLLERCHLRDALALRENRDMIEFDGFSRYFFFIKGEDVAAKYSRSVRHISISSK